MTYEELIKEKICPLLPPSTKWWPMCFYHFTNLDNALGIIESGWIYGRNQAVRQERMKSDNASASVISVTSDTVKDYGRLYFRPLTPTQYHNEGYKPEHIRNPQINACCPVPVFFCLKASSVLEMEGVQFAECGLAGNCGHPLQQGVEAYSRLHFQKIYHNGPYNRETEADIKQYRHSEVVRAGGIPIHSALIKLFCRSVAEKQTLLYLLKSKNPFQYKELSKRIVCQPSFHFFYNNGIFVKEVTYFDGELLIHLNEPILRCGRDKANGTDLTMSANLYWLSDRGRILELEKVFLAVDYANHAVIKIELPDQRSDAVLLEILFDGHLMFKNRISLTESDLI